MSIVDTEGSAVDSDEELATPLLLEFDVGAALSAGGGACRVIVSGKQRVEKVELDPAVCAGMAASEDARVQAQRLITEATNDALEKCQNRIREMVELEVKRLGLEDLIPAGGGGLGPIGKLLG